MFAEPGQLAHVIGSTGGCGTELVGADEEVGAPDDVVTEDEVESSVVVVASGAVEVSAVEDPEPHAGASNDAATATTNVRTRVGRRMSS